MNLLIIIADQLATRALTCYGGQYPTPNIDRIASRGVAFDRCYSPSPLCQPARAAFWTGRWPHQTGVVSNGRKAPVTPVADAMPTLGTLLTSAGYAAHHFGKTHDNGSLRGFTVHPSEDRPVDEDPRFPVNRDTRRDRDTAEKVAAFLGNGGGEPWAVVADFNNPHNICAWVGEHQGPEGAARLTDRDDLPELPDNFDDDPDDFAQRPAPVQYVCCTHNRLAQTQGWTPTTYRHYLAAYHHYVGRLDAEVGRVLDAVEARPDAEDTLVIFFADHGDGMASHRMVTKQVTFHEETTRVPFIVAGPPVAQPGSRSTQLVSLLDLLPTLCDAAGAAPPTGLWGRSLLPWVSGSRSNAAHDYVASEWHTEWGFTVEPGRMIRTGRYKYTRYREGDGEELFDLLADPGERRTLVNHPAHADALARHREILRRHAAATGDPFSDLQPRVDPRWRTHAPGYQHHVGPAAPMVE